MVFLKYPVKDPLRAEQMLLQLRFKGLSDVAVLAWWEQADIGGNGSPRDLWKQGRFDEVERAAANVMPRSSTK
jgi:hypothetical protein